MPWVNLSALWKIIVFGLIAGVGLPSLFALGVTALSHNRGGSVATAGGHGGHAPATGDRLIGNSTAGAFIAVIAFLIVLAAIGWSIYEIYTLGHPSH